MGGGSHAPSPSHGCMHLPPGLGGLCLSSRAKKRRKQGYIGCWQGRHRAGLQPAPASPSPLSHGFNACLEIQYLGFRLPLYSRKVVLSAAWCGFLQQLFCLRAPCWGGVGRRPGSGRLQGARLCCLWQGMHLASDAAGFVI